jgi:hypothetical protein
LQSYGLVSQFKVFIEATQATAAAASLYTISAIAIFDAMSTLLHLTAALVVVDPLLLSFSILAFVNFVSHTKLDACPCPHPWPWYLSLTSMIKVCWPRLLAMPACRSYVLVMCILLFTCLAHMVNLHNLT